MSCTSRRVGWKGTARSAAFWRRGRTIDVEKKSNGDRSCEGRVKLLAGKARCGEGAVGENAADESPAGGGGCLLDGRGGRQLRSRDDQWRTEKICSPKDLPKVRLLQSKQYTRLKKNVASINKHARSSRAHFPTARSAFGAFRTVGHPRAKFIAHRHSLFI